MSFKQELSSWFSPPALQLSPPPKPGAKAPEVGELQFTGKPTVVAFLRHCGCPFSEKTFRLARDAAKQHPDIHFVAISHSNAAHTQKWLGEVGGAGAVQVIVDDQRQIYARYGLGTSSWIHVLSPSGLSSLISTAREGITNRPTESGYRWQTSGTWAVNSSGHVIWGGPAKGAEDIPDFEDVVAKL